MMDPIFFPTQAARRGHTVVVRTLLAHIRRTTNNPMVRKRAHTVTTTTSHPEDTMSRKRARTISTDDEEQVDADEDDGQKEADPLSAMLAMENEDGAKGGTSKGPYARSENGARLTKIYKEFSEVLEEWHFGTCKIEGDDRNPYRGRGAEFSTRTQPLMPRPRLGKEVAETIGGYGIVTNLWVTVKA